MDIQKARQFIQLNYKKNRTIVSADVLDLLNSVEKTVGLPVIRHAFPSGSEYATWIIPPQWDVREAWLKNDKGKLIASYNDHPLFVAPYSKSVQAKISKEELLSHIVSSSKQPNAYVYNHRLAYHAKLRLQDWCLSLPQSLVDDLEDGLFEVYIDVDVKKGEMLVGEMILAGESQDTIAFLADWCHPGQVNDSFSGLVVFMEVMRALAQRPLRRYTYKLLMFPETIGSAVYIGSNPAGVQDIRAAIFSEMVGWGKDWFLKGTRTGDNYLDIVAADCCRRYSNLNPAPFLSLYGNDEYIFDSVQVGIPTLSLQKYPFEEYHTSNDSPLLLKDENLYHAYELISYMVDVLEKDQIFEFEHPVPFYMSRFDLYSDAVQEPELNRQNREIQLRLDGQSSLVKISNDLDLPFDTVFQFVDRMRTHKLVRSSNASIWDKFSNS